jgi:hypothetical protein
MHRRRRRAWGKNINAIITMYTIQIWDKLP